MMDLHLLKKYSLKYKFFWGACALILAGNMAFYGYVIVRQKTMIERLQEQYASRRQLGASEFNRNNPLLKLEMARQSWHAFTETLPPRSMIAQWIKELRKTIRQYGLSSNRLIFRPEKIDSLELLEYSIDISVVGEYGNVRLFLADIQNSATLFCINKLALKQAKQERLVNLKLGIATYCRL